MVIVHSTVAVEITQIIGRGGACSSRFVSVKLFVYEMFFVSLLPHPSPIGDTFPKGKALVVTVRSTVTVEIAIFDCRDRRPRRSVLFWLNCSISGGPRPSPTEYGGNHSFHHNRITLAFPLGKVARLAVTDEVFL